MCYTYDSLNRVTARTIKTLSDEVISSESYTYDAAGNIIDAPDSCFTYDNNNRLTVFNGKSVSYDLDGNMLSDGNTEYEYDSANRLIKAGDHTYTYNAEDVRIRNLCSDADTTYTYNTNCKLSQLLTKTTHGITTKYVYGHGLIYQEKQERLKVFHYDYRGSTVAVTDDWSSVIITFKYDTYGNVIDRTGTTYLIFGYNGRDGVITDRNGLIYMRARYYSPEMRRFINADVLHGAISDSTSLNRYAYVNGNPVSFVDPFGLEAERTYYDRDAAVEYAIKYAYGHNGEYAPLDSLWFILYYALAFQTRIGSDCANFVSQCLIAGGLKENSDWYYNVVVNKMAETSSLLPFYYTESGRLTISPFSYRFSGTWIFAHHQYKYFSNPENGYINGDVITVNSPKDIGKVISENNIQKGDLLYWSKDGGKTIHHASIISYITETDIKFAAHTDPYEKQSIIKSMENNGESVVIVRLNDYF